MTNMKSRHFREIHFSDDLEKDFSFWVINKDNVVVDSQPFQAAIWRGLKVLNEPTSGERLIVQRDDDEPGELKHMVSDVRIPTDYFPFWEDPHNLPEAKS